MFGKKKGKSKVFGVSLCDSVLSNKSTSNHLVADIVYDVIGYLEKHGKGFFFFFSPLQAPFQFCCVLNVNSKGCLWILRLVVELVVFVCGVVFCAS